MNMILFEKTVYYVLFSVLGLCVGSFLNVVIYRVPNKMSIAFPASHCPKCNYKLKWYDNIPVLSYIILGGKCRNCKLHISFRYTAVEILNTLLWVLCFNVFGSFSIVYSVLAAVTCSVLICVFFIDLENMIIPDRFQIILGVLAIIGIIIEFVIKKDKGFISNIIGGIAGFAVFYLFAFFGEKIAKREALGGGDIKLAAVMGLFLGWQRLLLSLIIASLSACIVILIVKLKKDNKSGEYPFAPFLSTGFVISLLFGEQIINAYLSIVLNI